MTHYTTGDSGISRSMCFPDDSNGGEHGGEVGTQG